MGSVQPPVKGTDEITAFRMLAQRVFTLDGGIRWISLEEAGCAPRWAWQDPANGCLRLGATPREAEAVDPLILMLAERHGKPEPGILHQLRFVVLAYPDSVQVLARLGTSAYLSVGLVAGANAYAFANRLIALIEPSN